MFYEDYELIPIPDNNVYAIKLITGPFAGITYCYDKCSLEDEKDHATLNFEYDIIEDINEEYDIKLFEKYIGDTLLDIMESQLADNSIVYSGGVEDISNAN